MLWLERVLRVHIIIYAISFSSGFGTGRARRGRYGWRRGGANGDVVAIELEPELL